MISPDPVMRIELHQARAMLEAMGYACETLDFVADIPAPALAAVRHAWDSTGRGDMLPWEVERILTYMYEVMLDSRRRTPAVHG